MFSKVLHIIWILIPIFFLLMWLWTKLETVAGKKRHENSGDFFTQGIFVLACVGIAYVIDLYLLKGIVSYLSFLGIPYGVYQIALLPAVLLIAAKIVGPTKDVMIDKAPNPSKRRSR